MPAESEIIEHALVPHESEDLDAFHGRGRQGDWAKSHSGPPGSVFRAGGLLDQGRTVLTGLRSLGRRAIPYFKALVRFPSSKVRPPLDNRELGRLAQPRAEALRATLTAAP